MSFGYRDKFATPDIENLAEEVSLALRLEDEARAAEEARLEEEARAAAAFAADVTPPPPAVSDVNGWLAVAPTNTGEEATA